MTRSAKICMNPRKSERWWRPAYMLSNIYSRIRENGCYKGVGVCSYPIGHYPFTWVVCKLLCANLIGKIAHIRPYIIQGTAIPCILKNV